MNSANLVKALAKPRGHRGPRGVGHVMIDGANRRMRLRSPMAWLTFGIRAYDIVTDGLYWPIYVPTFHTLPYAVF